MVGGQHETDDAWRDPFQEQQTPLHIASRLGNVDIVMLLLQHGADVDANTKDSYTPLHIAGKEGQDEVSIGFVFQQIFPTLHSKFKKKGLDRVLPSTKRLKKSSLFFNQTTNSLPRP